MSFLSSTLNPRARRAQALLKSQECCLCSLLIRRLHYGANTRLHQEVAVSAGGAQLSHAKQVVRAALNPLTAFLLVKTAA